jgi:glycosyltransferase involved in cell wall biosynthesis
VLRVQRREKNERGKLSYLARVGAFFARSMFVLTREQLRRRYDIVHVHSVPDFEVFAALVPKLGGAKLILDIHDIVPEFYAAKFGVAEGSAVVRALKLAERWSTGFADHVIVANDIWLEKIANRAVRREKCSAFINFPDTTVFRTGLRTRKAHDGEFVMHYPGTLNWHQGLDIAIRAFAIAQRSAPDLRFHIHGEGSAKPALRALVDELGLADRVHLHAPLPLRAIAGVMAQADLGVVPKRNDPFGGEAFSTKILEFMALGVPVVVARTRIDQHYFDDSLVRFFEPGDEHDLARAMLDAVRDRTRSAELAARAQAFARTHNWGERQGLYLDIVRRLVHGQA